MRISTWKSTSGLIVVLLQVIVPVDVAGMSHSEIEDWLGRNRQLLPIPEMMSWDEAYERADGLLKKMTIVQKYAVLNGVGYSNNSRSPDKWWYVGNTQAVKGLGIPSLNMQDASAGFRPFWPEMVGTVTCWPSLLALAATWDPKLVQQVASAIGDEFSEKGANVLLGPAVNVHRIARGGRNFEYLSGEDPYLGSRLVEGYVRGVQSRGVAAIVKHWIFNEQETNRTKEHSYVDTQTAWELYYPPFRAAVEAGVAGAMCSYNRVGHWQSCSNPDTLSDLKKLLDFRGFVQSDWWAADSHSFDHGLDQVMPGNDDLLTKKFLMQPDKDKEISDAARRILASMARLKLHENHCTPPNCEAWLKRNVTSSSHRRLARLAAAESVVLLKNDGVLPLDKTNTIAVIGSAAVAEPYDSSEGNGFWSVGDYYSGGGSGHVSAKQVVTPLQGIRKRARLSGIQVVHSPTDDPKEAALLASSVQIEVAVVVVATTSAEGSDRVDLRLDNGADELIRAVAKVAQKTVVICQAPGAVLMPWRHEVQGIALMFLGGQETGNSWASVLFGDKSPEGRLPIMLPETEHDTIQPDASLDVHYTERLKTSYRNPAFRAAFPFGFGLSYTTFHYGQPEASHCGDDVCIGLEMKNIGTAFGKCVPQLYIEIPSHLKRPDRMLKGFQKTDLIGPGEVTHVHFRLAPLDVAYYTEVSGWIMVSKFKVFVADSSNDMKGSIDVDLEKDHSFSINDN